MVWTDLTTMIYVVPLIITAFVLLLGGSFLGLASIADIHCPVCWGADRYSPPAPLRPSAPCCRKRRRADKTALRRGSATGVFRGPPGRAGRPPSTAAIFRGLRARRLPRPPERSGRTTARCTRRATVRRYGGSSWHPRAADRDHCGTSSPIVRSAVCRRLVASCRVLMAAAWSPPAACFSATPCAVRPSCT